jgi:hypothetical protein
MLAYEGVVQYRSQSQSQSQSPNDEYAVTDSRIIDRRSDDSDLVGLLNDDRPMNSRTNSSDSHLLTVVGIKNERNHTNSLAATAAAAALISNTDGDRNSSDYYPAMNMSDHAAILDSTSQSASTTKQPYRTDQESESTELLLDF